MPPQNQISKNAGSLKGGNSWQNFVPKQKFSLDKQYAENQPLFNSPLFMGPGTTDLSSATYGTSYAKKPKNLSFWETMEKGVDYKKIAKSIGKEGKFVLPVGKMTGFGPKSGVLSGMWDYSGESPSEDKASLRYSWAIKSPW